MVDGTVLGMTSPTPLALMEMAVRRYNGPGRHQQAMRDELDLSETRFWQLVVGVLADPPADVLERYPADVARLRRLLRVGIARRSPRRVA